VVRDREQRRAAGGQSHSARHDRGAAGLGDGGRGVRGTALHHRCRHPSDARRQRARRRLGAAGRSDGSRWRGLYARAQRRDAQRPARADRDGASARPVSGRRAGQDPRSGLRRGLEHGARGAMLPERRGPRCRRRRLDDALRPCPRRASGGRGAFLAAERGADELRRWQLRRCLQLRAAPRDLAGGGRQHPGGIAAAAATGRRRDPSRSAADERFHRIVGRTVGRARIRIQQRALLARRLVLGLRHADARGGLQGRSGRLPVDRGRRARRGEGVQARVRRRVPLVVVTSGRA